MWLLSNCLKFQCENSILQNADLDLTKRFDIFNLLFVFTFKIFLINVQSTACRFIVFDFGNNHNAQFCLPPPPTLDNCQMGVGGMANDAHVHYINQGQKKLDTL